MAIIKRNKPVCWSEELIAGAIARQTFQRKHLVLVPRCNWTGNECDLLVVTRDLRVIDVEVKISKQDFKADAKKDKWKARTPIAWSDGGGWNEFSIDWPRKVWKHYFAMPADIWEDGMVEYLPSEACGVLLLSPSNHSSVQFVVDCVRRAKPNREADRLKPEDAVDIARLASLRMWDALDRADSYRKELAQYLRGREL